MSGVTGIVLAAGASERMGEPKLLLPFRESTVLNATIAAVQSSAVDRIVVVTGFGADRIEASLEFPTSPSPRASSSPSGGGAAGGGGGGQGSHQLPAPSYQPEGSSPSPQLSSSPSGGGADEGGGGGQGLRSEPFDPSRQRLGALPPSPEGREEDDAHRARIPPVIVVRNPDYRRGNMSSLLTATTEDPDADAFVVVPGDLPTIRTDVIDSMIDLWIEEKPWAAVTEYSNRIAHPFLLSSAAVESMGELTGEKVLGRLLVESHDARILRLRVPHGPPRDTNTPDDYEALLTD